MPNVALYARYSSDLQNRQSIDDQFNLCRQFAERQGWKVVGHYRDDAFTTVNPSTLLYGKGRYGRR
ncbi:recombinase family protein [Agrobacterium rhizogenes]|nr:recombinase family protein [Rhizobium rhizogenes]